MKRALVLIVVVGCAEVIVPGDGLTGEGDGTLAVDPDEVPIVTECSQGEYLRRSANGWECVELPPSGRIRAITAGAGLSGGGSGDTVGLAVDFTAVARQAHSHAWSELTGVPNASTAGAACTTGNVVTGIDVSTGTVACAADADSGGTVTSVIAGAGLTGGAITTTGTIAVAFGGNGSSSLAARADHAHPAPPQPWQDAGGGAIYYSGGHVGIGTSAPASMLSVAGAVRSTSGGFVFPDGTVQMTAASGGGGPTGELIDVVRDEFDSYLSTVQWVITTTGNGSVALGTPDDRVYLQTGTFGCDSATLRSVNTVDLANGTVAVKMSMATYAESSGGVYGNRQPRGLAAGTDRNNAIELVTHSYTAVRARTVSSGAVTETVIALGHNVYDQTLYTIVASPTVVRFFVDGVLGATHTTNIPTGALNVLLTTTDSCAGNVPIYLDRISVEQRR